MQYTDYLRSLKCFLATVHPHNQRLGAFGRRRFGDSSAQRETNLKLCVRDLAERGGFEPPVELVTLRRFSKPLLSTTQPPLLGSNLVAYQNRTTVSRTNAFPIHNSLPLPDEGFGRYSRWFDRQKLRIQQ